LAPRGGSRYAPVHVDGALFAADIARTSDRGRVALAAVRARFARDGVGAEERRACSAEHPSGTRLPGCLKVYVPDFDGPWRIVFQVARLADGRLGLEYVASGVAHPPRQSRARNVYELAHYRLHGRWPDMRPID
jgi:hypothetical protein